MAISAIDLKYSPETGHLIGSLPDRLEDIEDTNAVFVFSGQDGIPATALVLSLVSEAHGLSGDIVGFEMLDFKKHYLTLRKHLVGLIHRASPPREIDEHGKVSYRLDQFDLSVIDEDIPSTPENAAFFDGLIEILDDFYFEVAFYHINADETIRKSHTMLC